MHLWRPSTQGLLAAALLALPAPARAQAPAPQAPPPAAAPAPAAPAPTPAAAPTDAAGVATQGPVVPLGESLTGMARAEYAAARILYEDGDFQGALTKLKSALDLSKDSRLLWNMAACEKNLRHYALSLSLVERYVAEGGALVTAEDRANADAFIATIRGFVADLTVQVNEPGAEVLVDGQAVGVSPLSAPLKIDMGMREVRVRKAGFVEVVKSQELPGGQAVTIGATLVPERHEGRMRVVSGPSDVIQVDGKAVGTGMWEGLMPSGTHTLYVSAKGKIPYRTDVVVRDNDLSTVQVNLQNESSTVVVKEGVPAWVWVTGGVLVAGAGAGAYFLLKPSDSPGYRTAQQGSWGAIDL